MTATGGDGALTFTVSPSLPSGLSFAGNGSITGTATVASAVSTYTVTATDTNGASGSAAFSLAVDGQIAANTAIPSTILTQGHSEPAF